MYNKKVRLPVTMKD